MRPLILEAPNLSDAHSALLLLE